MMKLEVIIFRFAFQSFKALRNKACVLTLILSLLCFLMPCLLEAQSRPQPRGGIEFTFANAALVSINGNQYFSLDVMVSSPDANQRLGTGIVFINYNPQAFGYSVKTNGNVIVGLGSLIAANPFSLYGLILNDNTPTRLAITFEYFFAAGSGALLTGQPQQLVNVKFKVQNAGHYSGISFQTNMMANQQYLDDNATLFDPVVATDTENVMIPQRPESLSLTIDGDSLFMTWGELNACSYAVYSADTPDGTWQLEASGLTEPAWNCALTANRRFFCVTATGNASSN